MWVLLWVQLAATQTINHYHLGTYDREDKCMTALQEAVVLVTGKNESVKCLFVDVSK